MEQRTITTIGIGSAKALPDAVVVVLTIEVDAATPAEALRESGAVQSAVLAALGVTATAGGLTVQPGWDHERNREGRPRASSTVTVELPDVAAAGEVVTAALEAGGRAVRLQGLNPVVTAPAAARAKARESAFEQARRSAEQYAGLAGVGLGDLVSVSEVLDPATVPRRLSSQAMVAAAYDVPEGPQSVTVSLVAAWGLGAD